MKVFSKSVTNQCDLLPLRKGNELKLIEGRGPSFLPWESRDSDATTPIATHGIVSGVLQNYREKEFLETPSAIIVY